MLPATACYPATYMRPSSCSSKSELMREVLGEEMHRFIVENKREEWRSYRSQVTQWEIERFFPIL